jgi:hypothetical protein
VISIFDFLEDWIADCAPTQNWQTLIAVSRAMTVCARKGESLAPGGVQGFQDGQFGEGGGLAVRLMSGQRMAAR